jgi:hypothetical protein
MRQTTFGLIVVAMAGMCLSACGKPDRCVVPAEPTFLTLSSLTKDQRDEVAKENEGENSPAPPPLATIQPSSPTTKTPDTSPKKNQWTKEEKEVFAKAWENYRPPPPPPAKEWQLRSFVEEKNQERKLDYCFRQNAYLARHRSEPVEAISTAITSLCGDDTDNKLQGYILAYRVCGNGEGALVQQTKD